MYKVFLFYIYLYNIMAVSKHNDKNKISFLLAMDGERKGKLISVTLEDLDKLRLWFSGSPLPLWSGRRI
jgi:hypothetical protein